MKAFSDGGRVGIAASTLTQGFNIAQQVIARSGINSASGRLLGTQLKAAKSLTGAAGVVASRSVFCNAVIAMSSCQA